MPFLNEYKIEVYCRVQTSKDVSRKILWAVNMTHENECITSKRRLLKKAHASNQKGKWPVSAHRVLRHYVSKTRIDRKLNGRQIKHTHGSIPTMM